jgi:glycosyltransferase involved in cell wall biosynthesis
MDWRTACAAIIPCLNEEAAIGELVQAVREHFSAVFVIDDGSGDDTSHRATQAGAQVLKHPMTTGKGAALQTGLTHASKHGWRWALLMDGDGQHSADDIPSFFRCAESSGVSLVIGNRMTLASQIPLVRRWVNLWMSKRLSQLTGQRFPDSQCGFRLMNLQDWERLPMHATHFEIESEMLVAFAKAGLLIEFVPIQVIYKAEQSKIHPWRDTVRWLRWWRRARRSFNRS